MILFFKSPVKFQKCFTQGFRIGTSSVYSDEQEDFFFSLPLIINIYNDLFLLLGDKPFYYKRYYTSMEKKISPCHLSYEAFHNKRDPFVGAKNFEFSALGYRGIRRNELPFK